MSDFISRKSVIESLDGWATQLKETYGENDEYVLCLESAADMIEQIPAAAACSSAEYNDLLKAAKAMHTWIFLNSADEQAAYDECGLSDEMNAALGYGGQFVLEPSKER